MAQGFHGNSEAHARAGRMSSGNRTRGANRRGGRKRQPADDDQM